MRGINNCFSKIQLVGQKYRNKTTYATQTRFRRLCFGLQSGSFLLLVGYNIQPSSSSTNQNAALIMETTSWILLKGVSTPLDPGIKVVTKSGGIFPWLT